MKKIRNRNKFLNTANNQLINLINQFEDLKNININEFQTKDTAIINVDIINGFYKEGALASDRLSSILSESKEVNEKFKDFTKIFFIDSHDKNSLELKCYPSHCLQKTKESEVVDELKEFIGDKSVICCKNSTNGFLSPEYSKWVMENPHFKNFIILGGCSDICVMQYALTQRAFMNEWGIDGRVIVVANAVETYDSDQLNHNAELMNLLALYNMNMSGIELLNI